jgi:sugar fermentation stimulation protein A
MSARRDKSPGGRPPGADQGVPWPGLIEGVLVRRYKRFMADVRLGDGREVTAHCPNSGSMLTCSEPGRPVYLSSHDDPKRKLRYTWEMIRMRSGLVGVNTMVPNRLVHGAAVNGWIPELAGYEEARREVRYGLNSRVDILLLRGSERCYVEVKNCTLVEGGVAYFPDAVTSRGLKHLQELGRQVQAGHRAVIFFLVQRMDARRFAPADRIDPAYGEELRRVLAAGVEGLAYDVHLDLEGVRIRRAVPFTE